MCLPIFRRIKKNTTRVTYRVVLELCHPRPRVGVVEVHDRVMLLLMKLHLDEKNIKQRADISVT